MSRRDWMAPYRKPVMRPTQGHFHAGCVHACKCFNREAMDCYACRGKNFRRYLDSLGPEDVLERRA